MTTVLFILGGKVADEKPIAHFLLRLDAAIDYYRQHNQDEDIIFLVSGRWTSVTESFTLTEAEVGKLHILNAIPSANIIKEDISVELIGNYAFSKPLIVGFNPNKVVIFTSELLFPRNTKIAQRIFADSFLYELPIITKDLSDNTVLVDKEVQATKLFIKLFADVADGDDEVFRSILLYKTPYYYRGIIKDKDFFDMYWDGGYEHFIHARDVRKNT